MNIRQDLTEPILLPGRLQKESLHNVNGFSDSCLASPPELVSDLPIVAESDAFAVRGLREINELNQINYVPIVGAWTVTAFYHRTIQ